MIPGFPGYSQVIPWLFANTFNTNTFVKIEACVCRLHVLNVLLLYVDDLYNILTRFLCFWLRFLKFVCFCCMVNAFGDVVVHLWRVFHMCCVTFAVCSPAPTGLALVLIC